MSLNGWQENLTDHSASILRPTKQPDGDEVGHSFDELDYIIERTNNSAENEKDGVEQQVIIDNDGDVWLETWNPIQDL